MNRLELLLIRLGSRREEPCFNCPAITLEICSRHTREMRDLRVDVLKTTRPLRLTAATIPHLAVLEVTLQTTQELP